MTGHRSDNVFRISPGGTVTQILGASGDGIHALENPWRIAVDEDGHIYVTSVTSDNVFRLTPTPAAVPGTGSGGLADPGGSSVPARVWALMATLSVLVVGIGIRLARIRLTS